MNKQKFKKEAFNKMPTVITEEKENLFRYKIPELLDGINNKGIELGVAKGYLAKKFLSTGKFIELYGVDAYCDIHDTAEYKSALKHIGIDSQYKLLRLSFEDALELFPNDYFDFIYIDGFAHTGEEGGKTISDWYQKLKVGGIISGDDYHPDWPLVMWAVNHFASQINTTITITACSSDDPYSLYPSWLIKKQNATTISTNPRLIEIANKEKKRIHLMRKYKFLAKISRVFSKLFNQ